MKTRYALVIVLFGAFASFICFHNFVSGLKTESRDVGPVTQTDKVQTLSIRATVSLPQ